MVVQLFIIGEGYIFSKTNTFIRLGKDKVYPSGTLKNLWLTKLLSNNFIFLTQLTFNIVTFILKTFFDPPLEAKYCISLGCLL